MGKLYARCQGALFPTSRKTCVVKRRARRDLKDTSVVRENERLPASVARVGRILHRCGRVRQAGDARTAVLMYVHKCA